MPAAGEESVFVSLTGSKTNPDRRMAAAIPSRDQSWRSARLELERLKGVEPSTFSLGSCAGDTGWGQFPVAFFGLKAVPPRLPRSFPETGPRDRVWCALDRCQVLLGQGDPHLHRAPGNGHFHGLRSTASDACRGARTAVPSGSLLWRRVGHWKRCLDTTNATTMSVQSGVPLRSIGCQLHGDEGAARDCECRLPMSCRRRSTSAQPNRVAVEPKWNSKRNLNETSVRKGLEGQQPRQ